MEKPWEHYAFQGIKHGVVNYHALAGPKAP